MSEELLKQISEAAAAAGDAAAEEVWATAIFAANNASRRLQTNIAIEAKTQSDQLINAPPITAFSSNVPQTPPPPPPSPPSPPPTPRREVKFVVDQHHHQTQPSRVAPTPQFHPNSHPLFVPSIHHQHFHQSRPQTFFQRITDRFRPSYR